MILHQELDSHGVLSVVTDGKYIDLMFGDEPNAVQSRIDTTQPDVPSLEYTRAMCLGLPLVPRPKKILILGHGGGSLAKFYTKYCPKAYIDIVDVRPSLFDVSRRFFQYEPSAYTRMNATDALVFLDRAENAGDQYDLILLDVYIDGPANIMTDSGMWKNIKRILSPTGFCLSNMWRFDNHEPAYNRVVDLSSELFKTTAQVNLLANQVILISSHLDPKILNNKTILYKARFDELRTKVPLTKTLSNTKILRK